MGLWSVPLRLPFCLVLDGEVLSPGARICSLLAKNPPPAVAQMQSHSGLMGSRAWLSFPGLTL